MQPFFWVFRLKRYPFNNLLRGAAGFRIFLVPPPEFLFHPAIFFEHFVPRSHSVYSGLSINYGKELTAKRLATNFTNRLNLTLGNVHRPKGQWVKGFLNDASQGPDLI